MTTSIIELFGHNTSNAQIDWSQVVAKQQCPYLQRKCLKVRKSEADVSIGTCSVDHGQAGKGVIICPFRFLQKHQVFIDCLHLLTLHEPGNELHVVSEIPIPGGSVDYFIVSARDKKVKDFVGVEFQTLDTTGTLWPERQRFLRHVGIKVRDDDVASTKPYGMNWKMTAKTILVQLHHKIQTFEGINKHLVLAVQDHLLAYMRTEFSFQHLHKIAKIGDPMHIHAYNLKRSDGNLQLELLERLSTDTAGIATCLGLQVDAKMEVESIVKILESKMSERTLLRLSH